VNIQAVRKLLSDFEYLSGCEFELRLRSAGQVVLKAVGAGGGPTLKFDTWNACIDYMRNALNPPEPTEAKP